MNNTINLIGNLGQDINLQTFESGNKRASSSLATTSYFKDSKGELQKDTQWHNIVAWGIQADSMSKVLQKGNTVALKGRLQYRDYKDKDGKNMRIAEILVDEFILVNNKKNATSDVQTFASNELN